MRHEMLWIGALPIVMGALVLGVRMRAAVPRAHAASKTETSGEPQAASSLGARSYLPPRTATAPERDVVASAAAPQGTVEREQDLNIEDKTAAGQEEPPPTLPGESRTEVVRSIAASGADHSPWTRSAAAVVIDLKRELPRDLGRKLEFSAIGCFAKGCTWDVVYDSQEAYESSSEGFWQNAKLSTWPGIRARTQLEQLETGKVIVSWLLLNPALADERSAD